jgi:hypothetical protein
MVDIMGIFDFFKFEKKSKLLSLNERWIPTSDGMIRDSLRGSEPVWVIGTNVFERWIQGIEERTGQSLGRRLAHAAAESEEFMLRKDKSQIPKGINPDSWYSTLNDWQARGFGNFNSLDSSDEETRVIISNPAHGPICAGFLASTFEVSSNRRYRFRWVESKKQSLILSLFPDDSNVPPPQEKFQTWSQEDFQISNLDLFDTLETGHNGSWSIYGNRCMIIHLDMIQRFADYCATYLDQIHTGRVDYEYSGLAESEVLMWTAMADSIRDVTFESAPHILISKPSDWKQTAHRHLSYNGLGAIISAESIDPHGGVKLILDSCFHPAITGGVLLACWERAYGRRGKLNFLIDNTSVCLFLSSSVEIAHLE